MSHPMQKIKDGRFVENKIVRWLLDNGGIDLNDIAMQGFEPEEQEQFAQLIGYSVDGYGTLSYVSDDSYAKAQNMSSGMDEKDAEIAALKETLKEIRNQLRKAACAAFAVHPDDLSERPGR